MRYKELSSVAKGLIDAEVAEESDGLKDTESESEEECLQNDSGGRYCNLLVVLTHSRLCDAALLNTD